MKPALTKDEWEKLSYLDMSSRSYFIARRGDDEHVTLYCGYDREERVSRPHALAALCLHNQPFGFTREDVNALKLIALANPIMTTKDRKVYFDPRMFDNLADRIEALLPPEEE